MHKYTALLLLGLLASAAAATDDRDYSAAPPALLPVEAKTANSLDGGFTTAADPAELQRCLQKLKAEREVLATEQSMAGLHAPAGISLEGSETVKLRVRVAELLTRLGMRDGPKKNGEPSGPVLPPTLSPTDLAVKNDGNKQKPAGEKGLAKVDEPQAVDSSGALNPLALANVLYKAGNYDQALKAYRMISLTGQRADERAPIQYLIASCLRKMGKTDDAMAQYREVANVRGDDQLAACAQWQLGQMRWRSEYEAQLRDLQARRKALEDLP
jgi:tetratricopeptide (TPR) repeat protein